jgi:hypothetical protein
MYIMAPYIERPAFFELALDDRWTDTNEFFKNHREIGPFVPVARSSSVSDDLRTFLRKWQPGGSEYVVDVEHTAQQPDCKEVTSKQQTELVTLFNRDECYRLLRENNTTDAIEVARVARIVTPVTGAVVLGRQVNNTGVASVDPVQTAWLQGAQNGTIGPEQYQAHRAQVISANQDAPQLQGATNGTVLQNTNATVIAGINTAGTVRVNNLANLEALLNMIAIAGMALGLAAGACLLVPGTFGATAGRVMGVGPSVQARAIYAAAFISFGWMLPGFINWMLASSRDANLFS